MTPATSVGWYRRTAQGWELNVHVQPGARRSEVTGLHGEALKVKLQAPALEGKANAALIRLLADRLALPARAVMIVSGAHARDKRVVIASLAIDPTSLLP